MEEQQQAQQPQQNAYDPEKVFEAQKQKDLETFRGLGLTTKEDVADAVKTVVTQYEQKIADIEAKFTKLEEWVMRARMQGLNSGATDGNKSAKENEEFMKRWGY